MSALHSVSGNSHAAGAEAYDVVVVGAGFAGMYMLHRLRGQGLSVRVYEQGGDVGGTWYWNRYPGARCDVESMQYSYSFSEELQQEWNWSERYAPQPEILKYANHVADRFDLRSDIQLNTLVDRAAFDETARLWSVTTSDGNNVTAKYVVLATGCLSNARMPDIEGLSDFKGKVYHTGHWPHEPVDFTGLRVGVIGTGSSAIQSVPIIAEQASQLTVFQRTPNFSIPARNAALTAEEREAFRAKYPEIRRFAREEARNGIYTEMPDRGALDDGDNERRSKYQARWDRGGLTFMSVYNNLALDQAANDTAADFVREKIAEIVSDPETAKRLQPNNHPIGSKRICIDTDYFATFNRANVTLVDIRTNPIEEITANAVRTKAGDYQVDALVLATGFDAMTGSVAKIDIRGRDGQTLNQKWAEGPKTYLGLMSAGFPNLFIITGPGTSTGSPTASFTCARTASIPWRRSGTPRINGWRMSTRSRTPRSIRRPIPGTWAPTSRASRRSSCPISAASGSIARSATTSRPKAMKGLRWRRRTRLNNARRHDPEILSVDGHQISSCPGLSRASAYLHACASRRR